MADKYSEGAREFARSFKVGPDLVDCCCASAGLAKGLAFGTFARARADVTKSRPWRAGRRVARERQESEERAYIEHYIKELREGMEGSKGREVGVWHTSKMSVRKRYEDYRATMIRAKLPAMGSLSLFEKVWRGHKEIRQLGAKNHAKCDLCGALEVELEAVCRKNDVESLDVREDIARRKVYISAPFPP
eukprot:4739073-Pleurochrysis_carterae.AAC.1